VSLTLAFPTVESRLSDYLDAASVRDDRRASVTFDALVAAVSGLGADVYDAVHDLRHAVAEGDPRYVHASIGDVRAALRAVA